MTPIPLILYRLATRVLEPLAPRLLDARAARGKEDPMRVDERLGVAGVARPDRGECGGSFPVRLWSRY